MHVLQHTSILVCKTVGYAQAASYGGTIESDVFLETWHSHGVKGST